ncbi:MmcQ/YjbR family DNA-binding protein [uncultured Selenomonas sp.]|uniref:MmcQ/YjbR family DNA-binding protein n=1 Tax=uncultured Selenomonas sp. TaxID=159275 RepID=UPI00344B8AAC
MNNAAACVAAYNGCYPAYHINKRCWISIVLDDTMKDDDIWPLLAESHAFAEKGKRNENVS